MSCDVFSEQMCLGGWKYTQAFVRSHESPLRRDIDQERKHSHMMVRLRRRRWRLESSGPSGQTKENQQEGFEESI